MIHRTPTKPSLPPSLPMLVKWVQRIKYPHWNELKSSSDIDYENVDDEKIVYILFFIQILKYERKIHDINNYYMVNIMDMWSKYINNLLLLSIVYLEQQGFF